MQRLRVFKKTRLFAALWAARPLCTLGPVLCIHWGLNALSRAKSCGLTLSNTDRCPLLAWNVFLTLHGNPEFDCFLWEFSRLCVATLSLTGFSTRCGRCEMQWRLCGFGDYCGQFTKMDGCGGVITDYFLLSVFTTEYPWKVESELAWWSLWCFSGI